jgi:hypothetical protein
MAEFLSDEWVTELDAAARTAPDVHVPDTLVVETVVRDADGDRDAGYQLRLGPDGASVAAPGTHPADVVFVTDPATAWALHRGTLRAQDAFAQGLLKVRGRPELLAGRAEILGRVERAFTPVREGTTARRGR